MIFKIWASKRQKTEYPREEGGATEGLGEGLFFSMFY
jgi:hypothetical protein